MLSREQIAKLIPHEGAMCLLHEVLSYDEQTIRCRASNHRDAHHPLRETGGLPAICGVEYAAQAMAVHGALLGAGGAKPGVLAAVRDLTMKVARLDRIPDDLIIMAEKLLSDEAKLLYHFAISAGETEIMQGRATVVLVAPT